MTSQNEVETRFYCSECKEWIAVGPEAAGKEAKCGRCPKCGSTLGLPNRQQAGEAQRLFSTEESILFWDPVAQVPSFEGPLGECVFISLCITNRQVVFFQPGRARFPFMDSFFLVNIVLRICFWFAAPLWVTLKRVVIEKKMLHACDHGFSKLSHELPVFRTFGKEDISSIGLKGNRFTVVTKSGERNSLLLSSLERSTVQRLKTAVSSFTELEVIRVSVPRYTLIIFLLSLFPWMSIIGLFLSWIGRHRQVALGQSTLVCNILLTWSVASSLFWLLVYLLGWMEV